MPLVCRLGGAALLLFACCLTVAVDGAAEEALVLGLLTPQCYELLVENVLLKQKLACELADTPCLIKVYKPCVLALISKGLGYAITIFSGILKLPQMYNIVSSGDTTGLAATSFYLEVIDFAAVSTYNIRLGYPFSSYGENVRRSCLRSNSCNRP